MKADFEEWRRAGWLKSHRTSKQEIADLFALADRDIEASKTPGLVTDWRFNIAYNAALQLATAALAAAGYRAERANHHYRVIQSLGGTIGLEAATIGEFDAFRKKRNFTGYERVDAISETEAAAMRRLASDLRAKVDAWIRRKHPQIAP